MKRLLTAGVVLATIFGITGFAEAQIVNASATGFSPDTESAMHYRLVRVLPYQPADADEHANAPANINCVPSVVPPTGSLSPIPQSSQPCR